jgi:hypothetical protein
MLERLAVCTGGHRVEELLRLPGTGSPWRTIEPRLTGVLLFAPE